MKLRTGRDGNQLEQKLEILLEKGSVWSSESRLGLFIAFAVAMQDLAREISGDNTAAEIATVRHRTTMGKLLHVVHAFWMRSVVSALFL